MEALRFWNEEHEKRLRERLLALGVEGKDEVGLLHCRDLSGSRSQRDTPEKGLTWGNDEAAAVEWYGKYLLPTDLVESTGGTKIVSKRCPQCMRALTKSDSALRYR